MDADLAHYIVGGIVAICICYMQERTRRAVTAGTASATNAATAAAKEAKSVKNDLAGNTKTTEALLQVASATKLLVNSGMASQLELHAATARKLAELTKNEGDIRLAELAAKQLADHYLKHCIAEHCPFAGAPKEQP